MFSVVLPLWSNICAEGLKPLSSRVFYHCPCWILNELSRILRMPKQSKTFTLLSNSEAGLLNNGLCLALALGEPMLSSSFRGRFVERKLPPSCSCRCDWFHYCACYEFVHFVGLLKVGLRCWTNSHQVSSFLALALVEPMLSSSFR